MGLFGPPNIKMLKTSRGSSDCHTDIDRHTDNNGIGVLFPL